MAISQNQRIVDLLYAGHGASDVQGLLGVSEAAVVAAVQDFTLVPTGVSPVVASDVQTATLETSGLATLASAKVTGNLGLYGHAPAAKQAVTGALSTVADAPAKAVLTALVAALVAVGQVTDSTT